MTRKRVPRLITFTLAALGIALGSTPAAAQVGAPQGPVCIQLDSERDTLSPEEQKAAWSTLVQAFEKEGVQVDATGSQCAGVYTVYNVKLGESVNATIHGPLGRRDMRARKLDELPAVYSQMVKSLLGGHALSNDSGAVDRTNVTTDQTAPKRVAAESLKYVKLGYGGVGARDAVSPGPGLGFGYRYELDHIALDGSLNFLIGTDDADEGDVGFSGSFIKLMVLHFLDPIANTSAFGGVGVSWGGSAVVVDGITYSGGGLQGELSFGYEMLRASTIRLFGGVDVTLPFYLSDETNFIGGGSGQRYTPTVLFSVGFGLGKVRTVRVIND